MLQKCVGYTFKCVDFRVVTLFKSQLSSADVSECCIKY